MTATRFTRVLFHAVVLSTLCGLWAGCEATPRATAPTPALLDPPLEQSTAQVIIDNFSFRPDKLVIHPGTAVTWVNHDDVPHTATATQKPRAFDSGALDTDGKYTFTFTASGTYDYFCAVHPHMTGQVIVR